MREKFIGMIMAYRGHHAAQISRLSAAVDRLSENRQDEQIRLVFEHVMSDLDSWIQKNRTISLSDARSSRSFVTPNTRLYSRSEGMNPLVIRSS